jgi:hypothetical protein
MFTESSTPETQSYDHEPETIQKKQHKKMHNAE